MGQPNSAWFFVFVSCIAQVLRAADDPLEHPFLPKKEAVVAINAKTNATATEIMHPCFARRMQGSKLEIHTTHGWGWVERSQMLTPKEAEKYLQTNAKDPYGLYLRSLHHMLNEHKGDQKDKALADLNAALKLDPKYVPALYGRGCIYSGKKDYDKALSDFLEAVKLDPKDLIAANDLAWFRATCPSEKHRDKTQAMAEATRICEATQYKNEEFLATLAAACAEAGDFKAAVKWGTKALQLAPDHEDVAAHLALFKANKPVREDM